MFNAFLSANGYNGGLAAFAGALLPIFVLLGLLVGLFGFVFLSYALIGWAVGFFIAGGIITTLSVTFIVKELCS